jgi:recombinational DNA repair protein (RecF pathway)
MQRSENTTGFIIKMYSAKEADQVIHLLSTKGSRFTLYAKGSRKEGSRKAHALDLLNLVTIKFGSKTDLGFINEVRLIASLRNSVSRDCR